MSRIAPNQRCLARRRPTPATTQHVARTLGPGTGIVIDIGTLSPGVFITKRKLTVAECAFDQVKRNSGITVDEFTGTPPGSPLNHDICG